MSSEAFDVVVIGAGLGGLTTAGYIAKYQSKRVLILENHTVPGGYAHAFRRGQYRFEVSLHALDGLSPGSWTYPILKDLEVFDKVSFTRLDPIYTVQFPEHEVVAHADPIKYEAELIRHFPHQADGIRNLIDAMQVMFYELRRFVEDAKLNRLPTIETFPLKYPHMLTSMNQSWQSFMEEHIQDPKLQGIFSTLWPYYGLPASKLSAATFILPWVSYHFFGAYYPEGGSIAMSRAIEQMICAYGGEIRYGQTVNRIEIRNGNAVAVETAQGLRVEADIVVSNANAPDTIFTMVGAEHVPPAYVEKVQRERPAISGVVIYAALDRDLWKEGWHHHDLFISDTYSTEEAYDNMAAGRFDQSPLSITCYNHADPTCAPEGSSILAIMTLAPWDYADQWGTGGDLTNYRQNPRYIEVKEHVAQQLLDNAEQYVPNLRASIKHMEIGTPLTNYRYTLNPGGSFYGTEQTIENMYTGRLNPVTPIPNLFLTGAWVMGGGMSPAMLSGRDTAGLVRQYLDGEEVKPLVMPSPPHLDEDSEQLETLSSVGTQEDAEAINGKIPNITLTAIGSKRHIALQHIGKPSVLVFCTRETSEASEAVNHFVDKHYDLVTEVVVASIVNLQVVPWLFRDFAEKAMNKSYQEVVSRLPAGMTGEEYIIILPDWDGSVTKAVGLRNVDKKAAVVVLDETGTIVGKHQGDNLNDATLAFLEKIMQPRHHPVVEGEAIS